MARSFLELPFLFFFFSIFVLFLSLGLGHSDGFSRILSPKTLGLKREKLSHLRFYFHDIVSGRNPTAVPVVRPTGVHNQSFPSSFGLVTMMDDPLTMNPELSSKEVGRAQGIYAAAAQTELSFLMALNFVFTEGKYNGSTLSVLGRNRALTDLREMPIVGGSRLFRFARGYAQAKTHYINFKTGDAVVEYNVYVFHY